VFYSKELNGRKQGNLMGQRAVGLGCNMRVSSWFGAAVGWVMLAGLLGGAGLSVATAAAGPELIQVGTAHSALTLFVANDGRLYELGFGRSQPPTAPAKQPNRLDEFYPQAGDGFIYEPGLQVTHADGNTSTDLVYLRHNTKNLDTNTTLTRVELKDRYYPFYVDVCFKAYRAEDILEQWVEIRHTEDKPVTLYRYASAAPLLTQAKDYWLTHFHGDWAKEQQKEEERLTSGRKVLDSKLGVRAGQYRAPVFLVSLNGVAQEETGEVYGGTLEWSGSFEFGFELDVRGQLRVVAGINSFGSQYQLTQDRVFTTPAMLWSWSGQGKGQISRNFHRWARRYCIRDGDQVRPVVLNNWEATGFAFDERCIVSLFEGAKEVGADTFLLDDGWFGNQHPRNDDKAGLGDWQVNTNKLPHGLAYLANEAQRRGVKFGIWLEPEMVNPVSDLFEAHPEWAIQQPHRELELSRNQLNLDLTRPEVREYVWKVIDGTLGQSPAISYLKWDANRYVTQPGSSYLPADEQSRLLVDYNWALYDIMARMATNYPWVTAMLCSGGGGRVDYGALKYFHLFWPSDNTDPHDRVFMQWGYSHMFPASTIATHVTKMGNRPMKFTLDVAMSGALGLDMDVRQLTAAERKTLAKGVACYKDRVQQTVMLGDLYRIESPYEGVRAVLNYVAPDRSRAVLFVYQLKDGGPQHITFRGLDPKRQYRVCELNLPENFPSRLAQNGQLMDGAALMQQGVVSPCQKAWDSTVIELVGSSDSPPGAGMEAITSKALPPGN